MIDLLRTRRSIRKYTNEPISDETRALLQEAVLRAPSSRGRNPWRFVFIDDSELLERLASAKPHGSSFLKGATLAIVVLGDETATDVWVEDCAIVSIIAHLAAHSLGLGSCWVQIRARPHDDQQSAEAYVQELLGIPAHLRVESVIAVGHPAETKPGVAAERLESAKVSWNRTGRFDPVQS